MKSLILLAALAASAALATNKPYTPPADPTEIKVDADATAHSDADAAANASSESASAADSASESAASADNTGNTLTTSSTYKQVRQAPSSIVTTANATTPCFKPRGVSLAAPGAGVGFSGGSIDRDCMLIAAADAELARGNVDASVKLRCATKFYAKTLGKDCAALLETQTRAKPGEPAQPEKPACVPSAVVEKAFRECVGK